MKHRLNVDFGKTQRTLSWTSPTLDAATNQVRAVSRLALPEGWELRTITVARLPITEIGDADPGYACVVVARRLTEQAEPELSAATYQEAERLTGIVQWRF